MKINSLNVDRVFSPEALVEFNGIFQKIYFFNFFLDKQRAFRNLSKFSQILIHALLFA